MVTQTFSPRFSRTFMSFLKCICSNYWNTVRTLLTTSKWSLLEIDAIIKWRNGQRLAFCYGCIHCHLCQITEDPEQRQPWVLEPLRPGGLTTKQLWQMQWECPATRQEGIRATSSEIIIWHYKMCNLDPEAIWDNAKSVDVKSIKYLIRELFIK